jgi:hypothetical protein
VLHSSVLTRPKSLVAPAKGFGSYGQAAYLVELLRQLFRLIT